MVAILKYNAGNIKSVENAVKKLGFDCVVTDNFDEIRKAEKVMIPGVGEASSAMKYLKENKLDILIKSLTQPVLGICLGMQLFCKHSEEGNVDCLGIFDTNVKKFPAQKIVPHMGWNNLQNVKSLIFKDFSLSSDVYFVHSYYAELCAETIAECDYILPFSASLQKNNFFATQFHPEKSGELGNKILFNFLNL